MNQETRKGIIDILSAMEEESELIRDDFAAIKRDDDIELFQIVDAITSMASKQVAMCIILKQLLENS